MWLNELKLAVVKQDGERLLELLEETPKLQKKEDMESAIVLLAQAKEIFQKRKEEVGASMLEVQKTIRFLESTGEEGAKRLDTLS